MNQPNFYGADFGFDSSNSSSTLTLKFDECEAITESSTLNGSGPETIDVFNLSSGSGAELGLEPHNSSNNSSGHSSSGGGGGGHSGHSNSSSMMDALRDNPVLTTASMPIPTPRSNNNSGGGAITQNNNNNTSNLCRMNDTDFGLDFDLSQDLNMPQILLMDGADLNDDSSPSLFGLGHSNQYLDSNSSSGNLATEQQMQQPQSSSSSSSQQQQQQQNAAATGTSSRPIDVGGGNTIRGDFANQSQSHTHHNQSHHHLLATAAAGHQMWGSDGSTGHQHGTMFIPKTEPLNLDDDAIYQVDKADLIQGHHFDEDPLLDISIDDISLLGDNNQHSLQTLHNVLSPISPSGYNNFYNAQQQQQGQQMHMHHNQQQQQLSPHQQMHQHHHHNQQQQQQQLQQLSPHQMHHQMQLNQNLQSIHSPPDNVSLYESLNRSSPYNLNTQHIVSPPTPTNSLASHYQSSALSSGIASPRARPISINQAATNASQSAAAAIRKYKTNAANQHTKRSALHDLLRKDVAGGGGGDASSALGQSVPGGSGFGGQQNAAAVAQRRRLAQYHHMQNSRLSTSAPTQLGMDQLWQRREPRPHLLSTSSVAEAESTSSLSTVGVLSPEAPDFSQDETYSDDSDHYEDFSSDDDSDGEEGKLSQSLGSAGSGGSRKMTKSERYFWQYNVQAKGPKGQRLVIKTEMEDPHVLNEVTDPVFSPNCSVRGIKHSGKARKGDGNDLTPNPRKLNAIGRELDKLFRVINDITPVAELPFNARTKTRKEKNKLASRACRLKKKAQHEANKIKLYGLEVEHKRLIAGIEEMKGVITTLGNGSNRETQDEVAQRVDRIHQSASKVKIGGMSTEYVNQMIQKVKGTGMPNT